MILTIIITLFLGLIASVEKVLSSFFPLQKATLAFLDILNYLDVSILYIRSLLPLTISNIFQSMLILFYALIFIKVVSIIKSFIPFLNRLGGNSVTLSRGKFRLSKHQQFVNYNRARGNIR